MQQFYFLIFMGVGQGGRTGKEFAMQRGVMDYLSNTTSHLPTQYKWIVPHEGILVRNNQNKLKFI